MPITIKQNIFKYKNPTTGQYQSIDAVAETTTSEQIAAIEATGTTVLNSIPADYTTMSTDVSALKTKVGTVTLNTTNKDLSAATNELNGAIDSIDTELTVFYKNIVNDVTWHSEYVDSTDRSLNITIYGKVAILTFGVGVLAGLTNANTGVNSVAVCALPVAYKPARLSRGIVYTMPSQTVDDTITIRYGGVDTHTLYPNGYLYINRPWFSSRKYFMGSIVYFLDN